MKNRMSELREAKGMSAREAAKQIGVPPTTYHNWEKGEREPNSDMLIKLADFFGVSIDYMIGRSEERAAKHLTAATGEEDDLLRLFRRMSDDGKAALLAVARAIK